MNHRTHSFDRNAEVYSRGNGICHSLYWIGAWGNMWKQTTTTVLLLLLVATTIAQTNSRMKATTALPPSYWSVEKSQALIDKVQTIRLSPDLSQLTAGERKAVEKLLEVGKIFQSIYEEQRHPQALSSYGQLVQLDKRQGSSVVTQNLLALYRLNQGPIATTLENKREPFLPVGPVSPGKNVYPPNVSKQQLEDDLARHPKDRKQMMAPRTVVRAVNLKNLSEDLLKLKQFPVIDSLHPGLSDNLSGLVSGQLRKGSRARQPRAGEDFYAIPYSLAYADQLVKAHDLLNEAAASVENDDEEFAGYLRNRARDLLSDDYESGDAAWVTGHFRNLNAQIGSYETYDDEIYGVKSFFAFSLLATRQQETAALRQAMKGLQDLEDSLPYDHHKKIREDIPVGVYDVVADFAQARGANTATILPNESYLARRYGRTILLRANIMRDQNIFQAGSGTLAAAIGDQAKELTNDGNFYRTLWHEVGHYLGVDRTRDNRELDEVLQDDADAMEEMKADLVSLFVAEALRKQGYYTDAQLRSLYASGISRVLQNNKPRRDQPYNTMQLMQWNFFLENGLLTFDPSTKTMRVHYDKYHDVVKKMLEKTLNIQYQGDKAAADRYIEQYTSWDENLHGAIARKIRDQQRYRFRLFEYAALGE